MNKDEIRYDLLKTELELVQKQIDKYDHFSITTKAWAVTLWIASIGWAVQSRRQELVLLSLIVLAIFWFLDSLNKVFRQDYKNRRNEVAAILSDIFAGNKIPEGATSPSLPKHNWKTAIHNLRAPHVGLMYMVMIAVSLVLVYMI
ncbi:MAG TPA: hypothetical protein VJL32_02015 [Candidatus Paceibacterota bacterium]